MRSPIRKSGRPAFGRPLLVAGLLVAFGCGESSGPGVSSPSPSTGTAPAGGGTGKVATPAGKTTKARTGEPAGSR